MKPDGIPWKGGRTGSICGDPATEEPDTSSVQSKVKIRQLLNALQHSAGAGFMVFRSAGCCSRRLGVRTHQPNERGSGVLRP